MILPWLSTLPFKLSAPLLEPIKIALPTRFPVIDTWVMQKPVPNVKFAVKFPVEVSSVMLPIIASWPVLELMDPDHCELEMDGIISAEKVP